MGRRIELSPVTRVEGHARVILDLDDQGRVASALLQVLEFRGFERFVQGMNVELMPTITTRICGTCPHAHHLAAAKAVDRVFSVEPPRPARLLRELLNAGSFVHSHAIHFFALAGPDLWLGLDSPPEGRSLMGLLAIAPELAKQALRLRSIGQRIAEEVGGRGTHPVVCVAGGMASGLGEEAAVRLRRLAKEAVELSQLALHEGRQALERTLLSGTPKLVDIFNLPAHDLGTVKDGVAEIYDGMLRVGAPDGSVLAELQPETYADYLVEEALPHSYAKQALLRLNGTKLPYRVGPLARLNVADQLDTPIAQRELETFRQRWGRTCQVIVLQHYARLIELVHQAERAQQLLDDPEITSHDLLTPITHAPRRGIGHVEAPRGLLIHDFDVDENANVRSCNLLVATQHNISGINTSVKAAADHFLGQPDKELLNGIEFAIRCWDPCLSCSTHAVGQMPLQVHLRHRGQVLRQVTR